jgi:SnoaL-like domain
MPNSSLRPTPLAAWHVLVEERNPSGLDDLLADDVVFHSPALFSPQAGKLLTTAYLTAALQVLGPTLHYVDEWHGEQSGILEFQADLDGTTVHGVDMIRWNDDDRIVDFTVMVRPYRGLEKVMELMAKKLSELGS